LPPRRIWLDGEGVHHHARLELLHLAHLRGLLIGLQIAVDDADAARLRHGNRHGRFGYGVHGGGNNGDVDGDRAGDAGADIDVARQDLGQAGQDQDIVESEPFTQASVDFRSHRQLRLTRKEKQDRPPRT
jgi:hypothetical protein